MKKTELVKIAVGKPVRIEDFEGEINEGWLMPCLTDERRYSILPFDRRNPIINYRPTHFKHLWYFPPNNRPALPMYKLF